MRNVVVITIDDLSKVENVVDAGINESSNVLEGVVFSVKGAKRIQDSLQIQAAQNARQKAMALAESVGATLGPVITITESGAFARRFDYGSARVARSVVDAVSTPVESGQLTLQSSISAIFELK
jgi:uncharacterized protein YggE